MAHAVVKTTAPSPDGNELRPETHIIKRQATQHDSLPSVQLAGRWGKNNCNSDGKDQLRKDPFHLYSLSPHLPHLQQSAGATPLYM
jgi:hypothetical protein